MEWARLSCACGRPRVQLEIRTSFPFPTDAVFRIFENDALFEQRRADLIRPREVARFLGLRALFNQGFDLGIRRARRRLTVAAKSVRRTWFKHVKNAIEDLENAGGIPAIFLLELPVIDGGVHGADVLKDSCERFGGVEIIVHTGFELPDCFVRALAYVLIAAGRKAGRG